MTRYLAAAAMYRRFLDWPVYACGTVVWMSPGMVAEAFIVPAPLAERAMADLDPLPVAETPGQPGYRSLLTQPHTAELGALPDTCDRLGIGLAHGGRHHGKPSDFVINLPPSLPRGGKPMRWLHPPTTPLPPFDTVATALLSGQPRPR